MSLTPPTTDRLVIKKVYALMCTREETIIKASGTKSDDPFDNQHKVFGKDLVFGKDPAPVIRQGEK